MAGKNDCFFSVVIPLKEATPFFRECLAACLRQGFTGYEVIVLPDGPMDGPGGPVRVIPTGPVTPARKRNTGVAQARGEVAAFLDSDAYPPADWLEKARARFREPGVAILGGPSVTPPGDDRRRQLSGLIMALPLVSGRFRRRYLAGGPAKASPVGELPACNLFVRREVFTDLGGFDPDLLTGEDAELCFRARREGISAWLAPDLFVYHHRRPVMLPHLAQVFRYGRDKARVLKKIFPRLQPYYLLPAAGLCFLVLGGLLSLFSRPFLAFIFGPAVALYAAAILFLSLKHRCALVGAGVFLTHAAYACGFLAGLAARARPPARATGDLHPTPGGHDGSNR